MAQERYSVELGDEELERLDRFLGGSFSAGNTIEPTARVKFNRCGGDGTNDRDQSKRYRLAWPNRNIVNANFVLLQCSRSGHRHPPPPAR